MFCAGCLTTSGRFFRAGFASDNTARYLVYSTHKRWYFSLFSKNWLEKDKYKYTAHSVTQRETSSSFDLNFCTNIRDLSVVTVVSLAPFFWVFLWGLSRILTVKRRTDFSAYLIFCLRSSIAIFGVLESNFIAIAHYFIPVV